VAELVEALRTTLLALEHRDTIMDRTDLYTLVAMEVRTLAAVVVALAGTVEAVLVEAVVQAS
jgi:hypothetical protein